MKCLILFLILTVAAQPLQAGFCDVETNPDSSQQSSLELMGLEGMTHNHGHGDADHGAHDCCNHGQENPRDDCGHGLQCGFCTAGVLSVDDINLPGSYGLVIRIGIFDSGILALSHSSPPYRPPIA